METVYDGVLHIKDNYIHKIILNEPDRRNPMSPGIMKGLIAACNAIEADSDARAVIVTGSGSAFSSGGDLAYNDKHLRGTAEQQRKFLSRLYEPFLRVLDLPIPTIAAINGAAVGGGLAFAMLCDFRIASKEAKLIPAFSAMGFSPGMGLTYTLERHIGLAKSAELLYTGMVLTGDSAADIGLVNRAVPAKELHDEARETARRISESSPIVNSHIKGALFTAYRSELRQRLERDILAQAISSVDPDYSQRRAGGPNAN